MNSFRFVLLFVVMFGTIAVAHSQEEDPLDPRKSWEITDAKWEEIRHFEGRLLYRPSRWHKRQTCRRREQRQGYATKM